MHAVFLAATLPTGDWSEAGAVLTFAIPIAIFIIVTIVLYFQYTRPHTVPGHRDLVPAAAGAGGMGRHAAAAPRHAAGPAAGTQPPAGGPPAAGGQHAAEGTEDQG